MRKLFLLASLLLLLYPGWSLAENDTKYYRSYFDELSDEEVKQLAASDKAVADKEWKKAAESYFALLKSCPNKYAHVGDGVYKKVKDIIPSRVSQLPPEALEIYRKNVSEILNPAVEKVRSLKAPVESLFAYEALFPSSLEGSEACMLIADFAFERANFSLAQRYYQRAGEICIKTAGISQMQHDALIRERLAKYYSGKGDVEDVKHLNDLKTNANQLEKYPFLKDMEFKESPAPPQPLATPPAPETMPHKKLKVLWKTVIPLNHFNPMLVDVWSRNGRLPFDFHPIVNEEVIILVSQYSITALKTSDGTQVWQFTNKATQNSLGYAYQSCLVADNRVYAAFSMEIVCLDAKTGAVVWRNPLPHNQRDAVSVPYIHEGKMYLLANTTGPSTRGNLETRLYVLDPASGKPYYYDVLTTTSAVAKHSQFIFSPLPIVSHGKFLYLSNNYSALLAYDTEACDIAWGAKYESLPFPSLSNVFIEKQNPPEYCQWALMTPFFLKNELLFAPLDSQNLMAIDPVTGKVNWTFATSPKAFYTNIVPANDKLFLTGKNISCFDIASRKIDWTIELDRTEFCFGQGLFQNGELYYSTNKQMGRVPPKSSKDATVLLELKPASPAGNLYFAGKYVIMATMNHIICLIETD